MWKQWAKINNSFSNQSKATSFCYYFGSASDEYGPPIFIQYPSKGVCHSNWLWKNLDMNVIEKRNNKLSGKIINYHFRLQIIRSRNEVFIPVPFLCRGFVVIFRVSRQKPPPVEVCLFLFSTSSSSSASHRWCSNQNTPRMWKQWKDWF